MHDDFAALDGTMISMRPMADRVRVTLSDPTVAVSDEMSVEDARAFHAALGQLIAQLESGGHATSTLAGLIEQVGGAHA